MDFRILTLVVTTLALGCAAVEDLSFCHDLKDVADKCNDTAKHAVVGNCTSYYKCDAASNGRLLPETLTDCPPDQYFDRTKLDCVAATKETIADCDQKKCEKFLQPEGVEKLEKNPPYPVQGQAAPLYPPQGGQNQQYNQQGNQYPQGGQGQQHPQQGSQFPQGGQDQYPNSPQSGQNQGQGSTYDDRSGKGQHVAHGDPDVEKSTVKPNVEPKKDQSKNNGSSSLSIASSFLVAAFMFTSVQNP